ncbi:MAG: Kae1-like domain-containing protein [Methylobacter sp.]
MHNTPELIAAKFHSILSEIMRAIAGRAKNIVLGGCFQNTGLIEKDAGKLKTARYNVYCHERIPPDDRELVLGQ